MNLRKAFCNLVHVQTKEVLNSIKYIIQALIKDPINTFDHFCQNKVLSKFVELLQRAQHSLACQVYNSLSLLIINIRRQDILNYLLTNAHFNEVLERPLEPAGEQVFQYYMALLKSISIRINKNNLVLFYNSKYSHFPLAWQVSRFYNYPDQILRANAHNTFLTLYSLDLAYFTRFPFTSYYCNTVCYIQDLLWSARKHYLQNRAQKFNQMVNQLTDQFFLLKDMAQGVGKTEIINSVRTYLIGPLLSEIIDKEVQGLPFLLYIVHLLISTIDQPQITRQFFAFLLVKQVPTHSFDLLKKAPKPNSYSRKFAQKSFYDQFPDQIRIIFRENYDKQYAYNRHHAEIPPQLSQIIGLDETALQKQIELIESAVRIEQCLLVKANPVQEWCKNFFRNKKSCLTSYGIIIQLFHLFTKQPFFKDFIDQDKEFIQLWMDAILSMLAHDINPTIFNICSIGECLTWADREGELSPLFKIKLIEACIYEGQQLEQKLRISGFDVAMLLSYQNLDVTSSQFSKEKLTLESSRLEFPRKSRMVYREPEDQYQSSLYTLHKYLVLKEITARLRIVHQTLFRPNKNSELAFFKLNQFYRFERSMQTSIKVGKQYKPAFLIFDQLYLIIGIGPEEHKQCIYKLPLLKTRVSKVQTGVRVICDTEIELQFQSTEQGFKKLSETIVQGVRRSKEWLFRAIGEFKSRLQTARQLQLKELN